MKDKVGKLENRLENRLEKRLEKSIVGKWINGSCL